MYKAKEHEELFEVKPIGVRYICEFCNEGEMIYSASSNTVQALYPHKCSKCHKDMMLPKIYPYIEWRKED